MCQLRGEHYAGHSSCPQVREIRREVGEKYRKMRTEQIVRQEQLEYDEDRQNFPKLGPSTYPRPYIPIFGKYPQQGSQPTQQECQTSFAKTNYEASTIENILQSFTDKMDGRLQQLQSTITEQLCDIEVKIDKQQAITNALESILYDLVLPSVKLIQLGLSSLEEWVHFGTDETLLDNWLEEYRPPEVRNGDLLDMVSEFSPSIISLNELGTSIPHPDWGCKQTNKKGPILTQWFENNDNLEIHNVGMKTSLRSDTTIDLVISTETISSLQCRTLPYSGSDHLPILVECSSISIQENKQAIPKTYWEVYRNLLAVIHPHVEKERENKHDTYQWFTYFQKLLDALKHRVTVWHIAKQNRPSLPPSMRIMIKHKHYLQNRYRHTRLEEDRLRLRSWAKAVQYELKNHRQQNWFKFLSNVASPNPHKFWQTVKCLNKKKTIQFAAITEGSTIHKTPKEIVKCLQDHFMERFAAPKLNTNNEIDKSAIEMWNDLQHADQSDINLVCHQSNLKFTHKDLKNVISKMNTKTSCGFDKISNKIVKTIPDVYYRDIVIAFNELFSRAQWNKEWKQSRTICFNKVDSPSPTTSQLRPISLLPIF
ncbi:unnamed protein product, partial [Didymodactylos carnosus]